MNRKMLLVASLLIFAFNSCNDQEAEEAKKKSLREKYKAEYVADLNKDFLYSCTIISAKTQIPLQDIKLILREYFIYKKDFQFKPETFVVLNDDNLNVDDKHKYDLISETSRKLSIPYNVVVSVYSEWDSMQQVSDLGEEINYLNNRIDELEVSINNAK